MIALRSSLFVVHVAALWILLASSPTHVHGSSEFRRLEKVAGDRQIVLPPSLFSAPISVRALASDGSPVAGKFVYMTLSEVLPPCPFLRDEFGYFGFNYPSSIGSCPNSSSIAAQTDVNGVATKVLGTGGATPSAFLFGATPSSPADTALPAHARFQYFSIVRAVNVPPGQPQVVVEYFHDGYRNYFNTIDQGEIDALDAGAFSGWQREVGSFIAWPSQAAAPAGAVSVCRFFASKFTSHFYTADAVECDAVVANFPEWQLETWQAYWILLPDRTSGTCPAGTMPVYRVFKPTSPNHRYVTDRVVRDTMVAAGWLAEGYGPDATIMCTPR